MTRSNLRKKVYFCLEFQMAMACQQVAKVGSWLITFGSHTRDQKKKKPARWQVYKFGKLLPNYILPLARFLVLKIL